MYMCVVIRMTTLMLTLYFILHGFFIYALLTLGEDKAQITQNSQLVNQPLNQPKQYPQTFDQSSQHVTKGSCVHIRMYV